MICFLIDELKKKSTRNLLQNFPREQTICGCKYYYLYNLFRTSYDRMSNFPWLNCLFYVQCIYLKFDRIMEGHSKENKLATL